METLTITLNGREVSGYPGMTILELARESGVEIPTLCHDPHLTPIGACRICIVEDERSGALLASCVAPIASGMAINTESPKVLERRATIVKLMLASHPDSCLVCDKGNCCELRKIAADLGIGLVELRKIPQSATIEEVNPFIERDLSKCILCAKCIRVDHEIVVEGAIDYINRGFTSKPATLNDLPLEKSECTFCGACVSICPTGALMEKQRTYTGTTATKVRTTCPFCGCGCSIELDVKDDQIVRVRPDKEGAVNHGALCVKGSYGFDFVHSKERLKTPLVRVGDDFEESSWENALDLVATEFNRIKSAHGSDSMAVLGSSKCTNEENYLIQKFARSVLGTNNIDNGSRLYSATNCKGLGPAVGFPGTTSHLDTLEQSDVIMVIGADLESSAPIVGYAVKRAARYKGAKLIIIDPRGNGLSSFAHMNIRPGIGSDLVLINALANVIVKEDLWDEEFVSRKTENFEAFVQDLAKYTPEYAEQITGVPSEEVYQAARLLAGASFGSIIYGGGISRQVTGTDCVASLANLAMLTGNIGIGGGIFALQRDCNGQGACDMGALPDLLPGYHYVEDAHERKKFAECWGAELPGEVGLTAVEMIEHAKDGKLRCMYIIGENPVLSFPQPDLVMESLSSLDFLVVQDLFLTETAKLANVVFPAASFAEKDGTFTNFEGRVQHVRRAVKPAGDSLPDWEIVLSLAKSMGCPMPYDSLRQAMDEMRELIPLYQIIDYKTSETKDAYWSAFNSDFLNVRRLYKGQFPSGFGRFSPAQYDPQVETPGDGYPLTLMTGSILYHCGSGSRTTRSRRLNQFSPKAYVELGESNAKQLGINNGDVVKIVSPAGEVVAEARITGILPEGMVFMPTGFPLTPVNRLFPVVLDPRSKTPSLRTCPVHLERT